MKEHEEFQSPSLRGSGRFARRRASSRYSRHGFNPLHCGAVVASRQRRRGLLRRCGGFNPLHCGAVVASSEDYQTRRSPATFQSPSLRGSGRFTFRSPAFPSRRPCFNPLHCGAVVASRSGPPAAPVLRRFNPLHCGAVVASRARQRGPFGVPRVSIPFIAGQWSLLPLQDLAPPDAAGFQSPSLRGSGRFNNPRPVR